MWQVRLLGAIEAARGSQRLTRFPSRAVAVLLARLALQPERAHAREELVEMLWPGVELEVGRNRLRQALSTLKSLLETDGTQAVIEADRMSLRVRPGTLHCDVLQYEWALRRGDQASALAWYRGDLMPGHYDEWVLLERQRLEALQTSLGGLAPAPAPPAAAAPAFPVLSPSAVAPPVPTGLPSYWTRSIGAELTASRLSVLVQAQRLATVVGPGGSGKTRLAVEVATALRDGAPLALQDVATVPRFDRIAFVPLADCVDAAQTLDAIGTALHAAGAGDPRRRIHAALAGSKALLVLDNLEQLDAAAGLEIAHLLATLPGLHVLATSRRLLDLDGEHTFELDGLALPAADAALSEAATNPAVMLFVDRARAARADFHLGAGNLRPVVDLVRLLGGMPLAIELASSRVRMMAPAVLLQHLSEDAGTPMLDLLARSSQRTTPGSRHASMRHVVDWSWRQLSVAQAGLLGAMSVFAASAQAAMVAAVAGSELRPAQALLGELVDCCLVRAHPGPHGTTRYALQQPVREFAAERSPPELTHRARQRLRQWLIEFANRSAQLSPAEVHAEVPHVHAAIVGAAADGAGAQAVALAVALRSHWVSDDIPASSLLALEQGLAEVADPQLRADAHELLANGLANAAQMGSALTHAEAAVAGARLLADDRRLALALARRVNVVYYAGHFDFDAAITTLDEAEVRARRSGDPTALATVLRVRGLMVSNIKLDFAAAEALTEQMQLLWEQVGDRAMARISLMNRVTMWAWMGRNEEALPVLAQCEQTAIEDCDWVGALGAARQAGRVLIRLRRWPEAAVTLRRSVHIGWQRRHARGLANALLNMPEALLMDGNPQAAARLQGFALAHWAKLYGTINRIESAEAKRTRRLLRLALGGPRAEALRVQGAAMQLPAAVALALDPGAA